MLEFLDAAKADGRIRYAGFSFHDEAAVFAPIVDAYDWDFCQIQYNYMDVDYQAGAAGLRYAAERGLGVIVMEPLKGGRLAGRVPAAVQALWDTAPVKRTPVEWALRFVWDDRRVSLLLSGMTTMEQVVTNVALADEGYAGSLSRVDLELIEQVREAYKARTVGRLHRLPLLHALSVGHRHPHGALLSQQRLAFRQSWPESVPATSSRWTWGTRPGLRSAPSAASAKRPARSSSR